MIDTYIPQQGWQCPICKRIYSPHTFMCYYCGGEQKIETTTETTTATNSPYRDTVTIKLGEPVKCNWVGTDPMTE